MKKIVIAGLLLSAGVLSAQNIKPTYKVIDQQVKATYYYDNGNVKQEGYYNKDGKLNGKWVSYNQDGSKQAIGEYTNGAKTGKWFFWSDNTLSEVDYTDSRIAEIRKWSKDAVVLNK